MKSIYMIGIKFDAVIQIR